MKNSSLIDRLEQDARLCKKKIEELQAKGRECMDEQQRLARTSVALEMLR